MPFLWLEQVPTFESSDVIFWGSFIFPRLVSSNVESLWSSINVLGIFACFLCLKLEGKWPVWSKRKADRLCVYWHQSIDESTLKRSPGPRLEYAWISYSVVLYTYAGPQVLSTIFLTYLNITSSARKRPRDYGDSFKSAHVHIWEPKGHTIFRGSSVTNITTYYWSSEEFSRCLSKGLFILLSNHHPYVSDRETLEEL